MLLGAIVTIKLDTNYQLQTVSFLNKYNPNGILTNEKLGCEKCNTIGF
jgi:hypothetical protein